MEISEFQIKFAIKTFINALPSEGWYCDYNKLENYNVSAFSQKTEIIKYRLDVNNSKIESVILTENENNSECDIALEVIFSNKPDCIFSLPLDDSNKIVLSEIISQIKYTLKENLNQDIFENLSL